MFGIITRYENFNDCHCAGFVRFVRERIAREWRKGDEVSVRFALKEERHALNGCHAVTRGPLVMAKDSRFGDTLVDFETAGNQWSPVNTYVTWMPDDE